MESENKRADSPKKSENKENQDVDEFREELIKPNSLVSGHKINPLLAIFSRSRWLDFGLAFLFFCIFMDRDETPPPQKKRTWRVSSHVDLTLGQQRIYSYFN